MARQPPDEEVRTPGVLQRLQELNRLWPPDGTVILAVGESEGLNVDPVRLW